MKQILAIDVPSDVAEKIKNFFLEKNEFHIFSEETVDESVSDMTIVDESDGIHIVLLNLRCTDDLSPIGLANYVVNVISLVRDAIEANVPMVVTCADPGNQVSKSIDVLRFGDDVIYVIGKIIPDDLVKLFGKILSTTIDTQRCQFCSVI